MHHDDTDEDNSEEEEEEEQLTHEQLDYIKQTVIYCRKNVPVIREDEVKKICVDLCFDAVRIDEYIGCFKTEKKY